MFEHMYICTVYTHVRIYVRIGTCGMTNFQFRDVISLIPLRYYDDHGKLIAKTVDNIEMNPYHRD